MYRVEQLLEGLEYQCIQGSVKTEISQVAYDSRKVVPGALFICIRGNETDGHRYIGEAVEKGAAAILAEDGIEVPPQVTVLRTKNTRMALAAVSSAWFGHPARRMKIIGVTGTKGKTTTAWMIWEIFRAAGYEAGLIGTIQVRFGDIALPAEHTTPESYELHRIFRQMADAGCGFVVMEVSSQALKLYRTAGIFFDVAIFTNLEPDHIGPGEHADFAEYMECKSRLFAQCRLGILNRDDAHWQRMVREKRCQVRTFGMSSRADYYAKDAQLLKGAGFLGIHYHVCGRTFFPVQVAAPGMFSVYNSLAAIAVGHCYGVPDEVMKQVLENVKVKGRIEMVPVSDRFTVLVDYAHNAMALENLLTTLLEYHPGRLICLFGCGGNRARARRFEMGEISGQLADLTVITSDNPRYEDPQAIIEDIKTGIRRTKGVFVEIPDRREAVAYAISHAKPGDIVVIAGKGHEDYQEIRGEKFPMDDRKMAGMYRGKIDKNTENGR